MREERATGETHKVGVAAGPPFLVDGTAPGQGVGEEKVNPIDGAAMAWVPGTAEAWPNGEFRRGSTSEEIDRLWAVNGWSGGTKEYTTDEQPAHEAELDGFRLYKHEVTVGQSARFLAATAHSQPNCWENQQEHVDMPVILLPCDDAAAHCEWAGGSLPTEAQWEYAARGPQER